MTERSEFSLIVMPYGVYISAEGAYAQSKRMEVLSNNLANVETPGFKRDLALFQARHAEEIARGEAVPGTGSINDMGGGILFRGTATDFSPGQLRRTGTPSDMAINGDGFFVIEKDGKQYLSRAGNFLFNNNGELVTQDGNRVMSESNTPITIDSNLPFTVTQDGAIQQGIDKVFLALARPKELGDMSKVGENLFMPLAPIDQVPIEQRDVRGGYLELSGVRPTTEMLELIETTRAFEANVNMIKNHDSLLNSLVNRVLKTS